MASTLQDSSTVTTLAKKMLKGIIPSWMRTADEVDELLPIFVRQLATYLYSNLNKIDGIQLNNNIKNAPDSFVLGWLINNIIDFMPREKVYWDEENISLYKEYLLDRFFELISKKGSYKAINLLVSRSGLVVKKINLYAKHIDTGILIPEEDVTDWKEIWYTSSYAKYKPTAKFNIILEIVSTYEPPYYFTPFDDIFDYSRAINKIAPFHAEYLGTTIIIPASLQYTSFTQVPALSLIELDFGKLQVYDVSGYVSSYPVLNKYLAQSPGVAITDVMFTEQLGSSLKEGELSFLRRVSTIRGAPTEQIGVANYPTSIVDDVASQSIVFTWASTNSITLDKTNCQITSITTNVDWHTTPHLADIFFGNDTTKVDTHSMGYAGYPRKGGASISVVSITTEIPSGTIDGSNQTFTVLMPPISPSSMSILVDSTTTITDDGVGNLSDGGTVNYTAGVFVVSAGNAPGTSIVIDYDAEI